MFGEDWEPAEGELIDTRFDRTDPAISNKAASKQLHAAYDAELHADISDPGTHRPDYS